MTDWPYYLNSIKKIIRPFPVPYVTRLSDSIIDQNRRSFAILISTIISLRTKDQVTEDASERILKLARTPQQLSQLTVKKIEKAIYPAGFYRVKAKNIGQIGHILLDKYKGKVPHSIEELVGLPGVGRKTANLVLTEGFKTHGICVDVHVHRILNRIGIIKTKDPNETEMKLREILPKRYWQKINFWLVTFGQNHCKPIGPKCHICPIQKDCNYGRKTLKKCPTRL